MTILCHTRQGRGWGGSACTIVTGRRRRPKEERRERSLKPGCLSLPSSIRTRWEDDHGHLPAGGRWYIVGGASTLEAYDCQANQWSRYNSTHWTVDE